MLCSPGLALEQTASPVKAGRQQLPKRWPKTETRIDPQPFSSSVSSELLYERTAYRIVRPGFNPARTVFFDEYAVQFFDEVHSFEEERFLLPGMNSEARLLLACPCKREQGDVVRIIAARKATKREAESPSP